MTIITYTFKLQHFIRLLFLTFSMFLLQACGTVEKVDLSMQNFNQHAEGWTTLITVITLLSGWLVSLIGWISKHYEFLQKKGEIKDKKPVLSFISLGGYSLFRQFTWNRAINSAESVAKEMMTGQNHYDPTMIVGIGRGGAVFGSLISYQLTEVPILAIDRTYQHDEIGERVTKSMYPFRIPKGYLRRVLLVAGESHTRKTIAVFTEKLKELGAEEIRNCVFYNQILPPEKIASDVVIHYFGVRGKDDYIMPWQTNQSLHPSENKKDAEAQNRKIKQYLSEEENIFELEESGFYCMRHAQTEANAQDVFIGSGLDIPLSDEGKKQACNVGLYFQELGIRFDTIYCSPMTRCMQTANEVRSLTGGILVLDDRLLEINYGAWEGLSREEIVKRYPRDYQQYCSDMTFRPTDSEESLDDVDIQIREFLSDPEVRASTRGKNVLVVTHKTSGRILLRAAGHNPAGHFRDIPLQNASISYVTFRPGKAKVVLDNKQC